MYIWCYNTYIYHMYVYLCQMEKALSFSFCIVIKHICSYIYTYIVTNIIFLQVWLYCPYHRCKLPSCSYWILGLVSEWWTWFQSPPAPMDYHVDHRNCWSEMTQLHKLMYFVWTKQCGSWQLFLPAYTVSCTRLK